MNFIKKSLNAEITWTQNLSMMAHLIVKSVSNVIELLATTILIAVGGLLYATTVLIVLYPYSKIKKRTIADIVSQILSLTIGDLFYLKYAQSVTRETLQTNMPKESQVLEAGHPGAGSVSHTTPKSMR
tara:strand:- start:357 stop:740 length:384 start_codon:yes stop_codon:yes gene_type:complete